jgi:CRP-like cAMP-binding protein
MNEHESILRNLQQLPFIQDLNEETLRVLIQHGEVNEYTKRSWILRNEKIDDLYFILEGTLLRCREEGQQMLQIDEIMAKGMFFGDILFHHATSSVRAVNKCRVLRIRNKHLQSFILDQQFGREKQRLQILKFIDSLELLNGLSPFERMELAIDLEIHHTKPNQVVFLQGDEADSMFLVLDGSYEVERDEEVIANLGNNDSFGEMGIFLQKKRNATIRSTTAGMLITISNVQLQRILQKNYQTEYAIEQLASKRQVSQ